MRVKQAVVSHHVRLPGVPRVSSIPDFGLHTGTTAVAASITSQYESSIIYASLHVLSPLWLCVNLEITV